MGYSPSHDISARGDTLIRKVIRVTPSGWGSGPEIPTCGNTKVSGPRFIVSPPGTVKSNTRLSRGRAFGLVLGRRAEDTQWGNVSVRCSFFVSRNAARRLGAHCFPSAYLFLSVTTVYANNLLLTPSAPHTIWHDREEHVELYHEVKINDTASAC